MAWADVLSESTQNLTHQTRPSRPTYLPPHLRQLGRGGRSNRNSFPPPAGPNFNQRQRVTPYDIITDKLDQVELTDDGNNNSDVINLDAYEDVPVEASGSDIPPAVKSFGEIEMCEALNENIKRRKYVKPTPIQRHAIPIVMAGRDLMACAQTGSGKTAAFCFPIISRILRDRFDQVVVSGRNGARTRIAYPTALILSPTRELSCQIHDEAKKFAYQTGVKAVVAYGGAPIAQQLYNLEKGVDILVATPGRLVDMIERERVSLKMIKYLALDEADRMLDMGFEHQIRKIVQQMDMPPPGTRQTMLFSATFPDDIQRLASDFLSNYIFLTVGKVGSSTDLIAQRVELVQDMEKRSRLMKILSTQKANGSRGKPALTLVFVETKRGADALEHSLSMNGFPAIAIHGDKVQRERERALRSFKSGATPILVATDVASRGLDIPHVAHVINFDFPKDIDDYVHRIGRTGRAGNSGMATAFFSDKNMPLAKALVELMQEAKQEVPTWLSQCAQNSVGSVRSSRYGRSKFGGSDFRSSHNDYYYPSANTNGDVNSFVDTYADVYNTGGYAAPASFDNYASTGARSSNADYYGANNPGPYAHYSTADDYPPANNIDTFAARSNGNEYGYGSIVASGWD
ncbi:hypothetical protein Dsin_015575 [Dipteronia sinensis]|uniref:RNA helicase n=1 Tax=Dipteronia sinensis TaxID=43782 RepID=A0AAE0ABS9_9ROSI|nr:hypothetical protein Dsin_015575 [Dipteronia sinensis]